jgi:hypothetical protein
MDRRYRRLKHIENININMASACSEDLPISPIDTTSVTESINSSGSKSLSRSPSNSSIKEDRWPALLVSKEPKTGVRRVIKCKSIYFTIIFVEISPNPASV